MPTPVSRDEYVPLLRREFAAIADLCSDFSVDDWEAPTCLPGWSVKDVVSHLVGTESMLLGEQAPAVDVSGLEHVKNAPGMANEQWVASMRPLAGTEVLDRFRSVTARRLEALEAMTQADFDRSSWTPAGPDETYGRFMRIRHYDCYLHELDLTAATGRPDRAAPDHVAAALCEPQAALGYIVGKKGGVPPGSTFRIRLTGPVETTYLVEVADRARLVERLEGEPTAGISLDAIAFLRRTGGRVDPATASDGGVAVEGDEAVAARVVANLAFTI